jgi:hypothetical protein
VNVSSPAKFAWAFAVCVLLTVAAAITYRTWPRPFPITAGNYPSPRFENGELIAPFPTPALLANVGEFDNELSAYLWYDYLRSRPVLSQHEVLLTTTEAKGSEDPIYTILIVLPNDALTAFPFLSQIEAQGFIEKYKLVFSNPSDVAYDRGQTSLFVAAYKKPVHQKLDTLQAKELLPSVARFLLFKSQTDPRVRPGATPRVIGLGQEQATALAADIIAVAKFYDLPLDVFLGIGAMENNYLNVRGDLEHSVWKRRAAKGDIILKHGRHHRVLVADYSIGLWQITRQTLRYAHDLYLKDDRDYSKLPERLRPPRELEFDLTNSDVLTTYAGLLLRDLLDRFDGDVAKAVGAYNGGPHNPNPQYAAGVNMVAEYARNILERVASASGNAVAENPLVRGRTGTVDASKDGEAK